MLALNRLGESHELTLVWVPGHQGIPGNETTDGLMGLGTQLDPEMQIVGIPFVTGKNIIKSCLEKEHSNSWKLTGGCK